MRRFIKITSCLIIALLSLWGVQCTPLENGVKSDAAKVDAMPEGASRHAVNASVALPADEETIEEELIEEEPLEEEPAQEQEAEETSEEIVSDEADVDENIQAEDSWKEEDVLEEEDQSL